MWMGRCLRAWGVMRGGEGQIMGAMSKKLSFPLGAMVVEAKAMEREFSW